MNCWPGKTDLVLEMDIPAPERTTTILASSAEGVSEFTTGHFFKEAKISYTESAEKAQRYTEMLKIG